MSLTLSNNTNHQGDCYQDNKPGRAGIFQKSGRQLWKSILQYHYIVSPHFTSSIGSMTFSKMTYT